MQQLKYFIFIILAILLVVGAWYLIIICALIFIAFFGSKALANFMEVWNGSGDDR